MKDQLPLKRFFRNFFVTRNAWGLFSINSHIAAKTGNLKQGYTKRESAERGALAMEKKYSVHFSVYRCMYCGNFHIGKNRDNKK